MRNKTIELYQLTNLPKEGWIQSCLSCATRTSRLYDYKLVKGDHLTIDFKAYLCPECKKHLSDQLFVIFLHNKCENKINKLNLQSQPELKQNLRLKPNLRLKARPKVLPNLQNELYLPVDPNPPSPRLVSSKSSTISI